VGQVMNDFSNSIISAVLLMKILSVGLSPLSSKKYRAHFEDGERKFHVDFGAPNATTWVNGASEQTRENYIKRHSALERTYWSIPTTPAALSRYLTWGDSRSMAENLRAYKKRFRLD